MSQTFLPARVSSPGRILNRELEAREWTPKDLAKIMARSPEAIYGIIDGSRQITLESAISLAQALDTSPEFWLNLEKKYQQYLTQKEMNDALEQGAITQ
jgi:HTH-type transcriptional regulator/antitoxin HigA